ncbi:MAG TPA: TetR family transcriptional regulator [Polyangiaceae bacterium]|nr:TetR family transcriptional regulator [Polyangiaceae bacterium]
MRINPEKKEDRERIARTLLRVTLRLASEHGFVSLGLREVSRAADIAPTSFYRHFADMEELGRELIESLAGPFIEGFVTRAGATRRAAEPLSLGVAREAIASTAEDPELMRFILAERVGAIPSFRAGIEAKVATVSTAIAESIESGAGALQTDAALVADAAVVLILGACGDLLDRGEEHAADVWKRIDGQLRILLAGIAEPRGRR